MPLQSGPHRPALSRARVTCFEPILNHANYSYTNGNSLVGQLSVALANAALPSAGSGGSSTGGGTSGGADTESSGSGDADNLPSATQAVQGSTSNLASTMAGLRNLAGSTAAPGGALQLGVSSTGNLMLSKTFNQPMAVGFGSAMHYGLKDMVPYWQELYATDAQFAGRVNEAFKGGIFGRGDSACVDDGAQLLSVLATKTPLSITQASAPASGPSVLYRRSTD